MKIRDNWVAILVVVLVVSGSNNSLSEDSSWWWNVGPVYRTEMNIRYSGSSYVQENGLHAANPSSSDPSGTGSANAFADRIYDDGFVNMDPGTEVDGMGLTWYWGYDNSVQYDASADTLSYHRAGGSRVTRTPVADESVDVKDDVAGLGLRAGFGRKIHSKGSFTLDVCGGAQGNWDIDNNLNTSTYSERLASERYRVVDTYALEGVAPPAAPYEGTYDGPGPVIPNIPTVRSQQTVSRSSWVAENEVDIDTEADLETVWIGVQASWKGNDSLQLFLSPFLSLNYLDLSVNRTERFNAVYSDGRVQTLQQWQESKDDEQWLLGVGVSAGGRVALARDWFVDLSLIYDAVNESVVDIGPNTVTFDPTGYSVTLQAGRGF